MRKKWYFGLAFLLTIQLLFSGCSMFKAPQQKPEQAPKMIMEPDVTVYMHETGEKKTMKMEEYIAGVVAGEMKTDWPVEALAAQAIIARTFIMDALETKGGVPSRGTQASTDIKEFQAYNAKAINDNVRKAVEMTRGMVATYQGRPIKTWFHSSAGGITATAKEGLNYKEAEPPYVQTVASPDDLAPQDIQNWNVRFSKKDIMAALSKMGHNVTAIDSVEIGQKGPSGRTVMLVFNKNLQVPGPDFRVHLDSIKLRSMLLDKIEVSGDEVIFSGKGYGHGVGMSQWGANKLAQQGKKPEEIVGYYFNGVKIEKRWQ
ncbi:MAG: SpoIID/LytB domain protein [Firmicutes bacterium]|nr:SpoIID/LytB domain protein [Bacillota bacterium]